MQVAALQLFLRSLVPALEAAGDARSAARSVDEACRALDPFGTLAMAEFAAFLVRAEEYQRTGAVRVPGAADLRAEQLLAAVGRLMGVDGDVSTVQAEVAKAMATLAGESGLKGKLTPDPMWASARAIRTRAAPHLQAIRTLAGRITSPELYADESVRAEIARLESALDRDTLKTVATEFGVKTTAKSMPAKVLAGILVKLSGHEPPKAKRGSKAPAAPPDPAVVDENVRRLSSLIERAGDPDAVSDAEVNEELARLKSLPKPTLYEVVSKAGIEGVKPRDGVDSILTRVRSRLTAARRARERAEV
jgi:hypothetical protein